MGGVLPRYGHEANASSASSLAAIGSRALSRMSLQGLSGAFSGLSGYLTNQGGAAVSAAKMCNSVEEGLVWRGVASQRLDEEEDELFGTAKRNRADLESGPTYDRRSTLSSNGSVMRLDAHKQQQQHAGAAQQRRYVRKSAVQPPKATPVWLLDFSHAGTGVGPVFTL